LNIMCSLFFFFFFQAEDGIRDYKVTGVQTCALPIFFGSGSIMQSALKAQEILAEKYNVSADVWSATSYKLLRNDAIRIQRWNMRSEERRVGKECRSRRSPAH